MAGTNGLIKYLPVNRDHEAINFARRNSASLSGNITDFSTAGGAITPPDILNGGFNFVTGASGTYTFPTAADLSTAIELIFPSDIGNAILFSITNATANTLTINFAATNVVLSSGATTLSVYPHSTFEAFLTRLSASSYRFQPKGYPGATAPPNDGVVLFTGELNNPSGDIQFTTTNLNLTSAFTVPTQVGFATAVSFEFTIRTHQTGYSGAYHIDQNPVHFAKWIATVHHQNNVFIRSDIREIQWSGTELPALVPANNRPQITALNGSYVATLRMPANALLVALNPTLNARRFSYFVEVKARVNST